MKPPPKLTGLEAAIADYLMPRLEGLRRGELAAQLPGLAGQCGVSEEQAYDILRRHRRLQRFDESHYRTPETTYDPGILDGLTDGNTAAHLMGWGAPEESESEENGHQAERLAESCGMLLKYLQAGLIRCRVSWKFWKARMLRDGETAEERTGSGSVQLSDGREESWLIGAVLIQRGGEVVNVYPDARVKRRLRRKGGVALQMECGAVTKELAWDTICRRVCAMLRVYKGSASGLGRQEDVAALTGVSKAAVSDMERRMAGHYRGQTGGRGQFEKVKGKPPKKRARRKAEDSTARTGH